MPSTLRKCTVHTQHSVTRFQHRAYVNCEVCTTSCKRKQSTALTPIPGHWRGQSRLLLPKALVLKFRFSKFLVCVRNLVTSCFLLYENEGGIPPTSHLLPKRCQFVMKEHMILCIANSVICDLASMFAGSALTRICRYHISKHLKGQLGPCVTRPCQPQAGFGLVNTKTYVWQTQNMERSQM